MHGLRSALRSGCPFQERCGCFSVAVGAEGNVDEARIANLGDVSDPAGKDTGFGINVTVEPNGAFTVVNERNNVSKMCPARK